VLILCCIEKLGDGADVFELTFCCTGRGCEIIRACPFCVANSGAKKGCCGSGGNSENEGRRDCEREGADKDDCSEKFNGEFVDSPKCWAICCVCRGGKPDCEKRSIACCILGMVCPTRLCPDKLVPAQLVPDRLAFKPELVARNGEEMLGELEVKLVLLLRQACSSALAKSRTVGKRWSGSFANAVITTCATWADRPGTR